MVSGNEDSAAKAFEKVPKLCEAGSTANGELTLPIDLAARYLRLLLSFS